MEINVRLFLAPLRGTRPAAVAPDRVDGSVAMDAETRARSCFPCHSVACCRRIGRRTTDLCALSKGEGAERVRERALC